MSLSWGRLQGSGGTAGMALALALALSLAMLVGLAGGFSGGLLGPVLVLEPPPSVEFSNSTGATLSCDARGSPPVDIRWIDAQGRDVLSVPRIRDVLSNGSLHFPPFPGELYTSEVHSASYRCAASNPMGTVLSREARLRADVEQDFQLQVRNVFALRGNVAVLRCGVPVSSGPGAGLRAHGQLRVSAWFREDPRFGRQLIHTDNRFTITSLGTLHIRDTTASDANARFYCQTAHRVTGERRLSLPGQVVVTDPEGNMAPRVEPAATNIRARAGNPADLVCAAQGFPPPEYRWFRESSGGLRELMPGAGEPRVLESVLQWQRVSTLDSGRYVCVVSNLLGEDRREVALVVAAPLEVRLRPQHQVVDAGSTAMFNCSVSGGAGQVHVSWLKDGLPLQQGDRVRTGQGHLHQTTLHWLQVRRLERADRGMYQCVAWAAEESVQASAELELGAVAPRLLTTFIEQTLQPGPPLSLRCDASGSPPPHVTWLLDGAELRPDQPGAGLGMYQQAQRLDARGDVIGFLNMTSVRVHHGGLYTCVARNMMGTAQHTAALNVYGPPVSREPLNLTVVSGSDVWLRCPVGGFPLSRVAWQRGSTPLTPPPSTMSIFANGSLQLRSVEAARDSALYSCTASNQQGRSAQGRLHLHVMRPPEMAPFQFPATLVEGNRAQVSCSLTSGDLPINISWRKDGGPLPRDPSVNAQQQAFFSHLTFSDLRARHSGRYTCIASNAAATANYSADLIVRVAPSWVQEPMDEAVVFMQPAALHCQVRGYPPPTTTWFRESGDPPSEPTPVESSSEVQVASNGSLLFAAVQPHLQGHYTCRAANDIGQPISKSAFLRVNVPAHFPVRQQNATAVSGGSVVLRCEAQGDLPLYISWATLHRSLTDLARTSERLSPAGVPGVTSELTLSDLTRDDQGLYHCNASNDFGHAKAIVYLSIKEPPGAPGQPRVLEVGSRWLSVAWTPPAGAGELPAHYLLQFQSPLAVPVQVERNSVEVTVEGQWQNVTVPGSALSARIGRLTPATAYRLRVLAVNDLGPGPSSEEAGAITLQEAPSGPPQDLRVDVGAPESITVKWKPPPPSVGAVLGYQVGYRVAREDVDLQGSGQGAEEDWEWRVVRSGVGVLSGPAQVLETTLQGLRHFTRYEILVRAFNQVGHGPSTQPLHATTMEGVPSEAPQSVRCSALSPQALRVRWEAPSLARRHGLVQGYKVFYQLQAGPTAPVGSEEVEVKRTTNLETNLHGLAKYANYSVRVAAFTAAGEGARSPSLYCVTEEDIPGPVEHVRALVMTSDSVLVAWSRPLQPNGVVVKYNVYRAPQQAGQDFQKETVPGDREPLYEARRLTEHQTYEFWVTASTAVGEGPPSVKVKQTPASRVPARIASFPKSLLASAGSAVVLSCHAVGSPAPTREWRGPGDVLISVGTPRYRHLADGALELGVVSPDDAGNYSCRVENVFGSDHVDYALVVVVVPAAPLVSLNGARHSALQISWKVPDNGGSPITGYILAFRRERGEWQEVHTDADRRSLTLTGLKCGSSYQVRVAAINSVGRGHLSHTLSCRTQGGPPLSATQDTVLAVNSSAVTLFPDAWPSNGCPLLYLVVDLKSAPPEIPGSAPWTTGPWTEWKLVTNAARAQDDLTLPDLTPASWYGLRVTAHNDAGSHTQEFVVATTTENGGQPPPRSAPELLPPSDSRSVMTRLHVVLPCAAVAVCLAALAVFGCMLARRRHYPAYRKSATDSANAIGYGTKTLAEVENRRNLDQQHQKQHLHLQPQPPPPPLYSPATARKGMGDSSLSGQKGSDTSAADYDICPYATFSLSQGAAQVEVPGARSPVPNYSLQFQTFSQRDCYEPCPAPRRSLSRGAGNPGNSIAQEAVYISKRSGKRLVDSPPDGLNLEISCISSQQTLPLTATNHRNQQQQHQQQQQLQQQQLQQQQQQQQLGRHERSARSDRRNFDHHDSSTESAEASPEMARRSRAVHRRGAPAR